MTLSEDSKIQLMRMAVETSRAYEESSPYNDFANNYKRMLSLVNGHHKLNVGCPHCEKLVQIEDGVVVNSPVKEV